MRIKDKELMTIATPLKKPIITALRQTGIPESFSLGIIGLKGKESFNG